MTYAEQIQVAIDFIEDRLDERFDLREISGAACISHAHFQRIFKAVTGETLKAYVRSRRLANSLELLATTDLRVLDIAVAAGFDAQESFARAFKRAFGLTPSEYRSIGRRNLFPEKLRIDDAYLANLQAMATLEPAIEQWSTMEVAGLATCFDGPDTAKNRLGADLPGLWESFLARVECTAAMQPMPLYGIVSVGPGGEDRLDYVAAGRLVGREPIADALTIASIPGGRYAVFDHRGPTQRIDQTVDYIYGTWLMRSGFRHTWGPDVEIYDHRWQPDSEESVMRYAVPVA